MPFFFVIQHSLDSVVVKSIDVISPHFLRPSKFDASDRGCLRMKVVLRKSRGVASWWSCWHVSCRERQIGGVDGRMYGSG
jgi:hypothetical protein